MGAIGLILGFLRGIGALLLKVFAGLRASKWGTWMMWSLFSFMGGLIGKIFTLLGVSLAVNEWVTPELTPLVSQHLLNLPTEWIQLMALTKIDQALTVIISAIGIATADRVYMTRRRNAWQQPL